MYSDTKICLGSIDSGNLFDAQAHVSLVIRSWKENEYRRPFVCFIEYFYSVTSKINDSQMQINGKNIPQHSLSLSKWWMIYGKYSEFKQKKNMKTFLCSSYLFFIFLSVHNINAIDYELKGIWRSHTQTNYWHFIVFDWHPYTGT